MRHQIYDDRLEWNRNSVRVGFLWWVCAIRIIFDILANGKYLNHSFYIVRKQYIFATTYNTVQSSTVEHTSMSDGYRTFLNFIHYIENCNIWIFSRNKNESKNLFQMWILTIILPFRNLIDLSIGGIHNRHHMGLLLWLAFNFYVNIFATCA